jgi:hypothetical protein
MYGSTLNLNYDSQIRQTTGNVDYNRFDTVFNNAHEFAISDANRMH